MLFRSVLAAHGLDVLEATVATWGDGAAIESFLVTRPPLDPPRLDPAAIGAAAPPDAAALEASIVRAFEDPLVSPPNPDAEVAFDDAASPWYTLCEVRSPDRRGLLHMITVGLAAAGASVHSARLVTLDGQAVDRFELTDRDGRKLFIRPIRPDDEPLLQLFFRRLTPEDIRMRFFGPIRELTHELAARLTQIDYDRDMAFLLIDGNELLGVGRLSADPNFDQAEFALIVASNRQRKGYGELLLRRVLDYAKSRGIRSVFGVILRENHRMLALAERLGFTRTPGRAGHGDIRVEKLLGEL